MDSPKSPPVSWGFPIAESLTSPMAIRSKIFPHSGFLPSASIPLFFSFIYISWRLITSQHCSGFCHTLTWISHGVTRASIPLNRKNYLLLPFRECWLPVGSMSERKRNSGIILSELFSRNSLFPSDRKPGRVPHSRRFLLWKRKECTSIPFPHTLQSWKRVPPLLKDRHSFPARNFLPP